MVALGEAGLTTAALNDIATESPLSGGSGVRQFTDLNLLLAPEDITPARPALTALDYHSDPAEATTLTRHLDDMLVPSITIDLAQSLHHTPNHDGIREILRRRAWQHCPVTTNHCRSCGRMGPTAARLATAPTHAVSSRGKRRSFSWPGLPGTGKSTLAAELVHRLKLTATDSAHPEVIPCWFGAVVTLLS